MCVGVCLSVFECLCVSVSLVVCVFQFVSRFVSGVCVFVCLLLKSYI